jgi:hypothetical protein
MVGLENQSNTFADELKGHGPGQGTNRRIRQALNSLGESQIAILLSMQGYRSRGVLGVIKTKQSFPLFIELPFISYHVVGSVHTIQLRSLCIYCVRITVK